jgi:hypothetical protein
MMQNMFTAQSQDNQNKLLSLKLSAGGAGGAGGGNQPSSFTATGKTATGQ